MKKLLGRYIADVGSILLTPKGKTTPYFFIHNGYGDGDFEIYEIEQGEAGYLSFKCEVGGEVDIHLYDCDETSKVVATLSDQRHFFYSDPNGNIYITNQDK